MAYVTCHGVQPPVQAAAALMAVNVVLLWYCGMLGTTQVTVSKTYKTNYKGVPLTNKSSEIAAFFEDAERGAQKRIDYVDENLKVTRESHFAMELNVSLIDPQYRVMWNKTQSRCMWLPTSHCTPYGNIDFKELRACHDIIPQGTSGFCKCPDRTLIGIPCQGFSTVPIQCAKYCKSANPFDYPTHRELLKKFPPKPPVVRPKGVIISFARTANLNIFSKTIASFESVFNKRYHYPYHAFYDPTDVPTKHYIDTVRAVASSPLSFSNLEPVFWDVPAHINTSRINLAADYPNNNVHFRQLSRFFSGFFYYQKVWVYLSNIFTTFSVFQVIQQYDWFWRLNEDIIYLCDIYFDPFVLMQKEKKVYGYGVMLPEFMETLPSLYGRTMQFSQTRGKKPSWNKWLENSGNYTGCHFWSAFTIGSLNWFRNSEYNEYFAHLDSTGNFFYERWADAPVHTLALSLFANLSSIYYFESVSFVHTGIFHLSEDNSTCLKHPVPDPTYPGSNSDLSPCTGQFAHLAKI